jgi:hypothetical protein
LGLQPVISEFARQLRMANLANYAPSFLAMLATLAIFGDLSSQQKNGDWLRRSVAEH